MIENRAAVLGKTQLFASLTEEEIQALAMIHGARSFVLGGVLLTVANGARVAAGQSAGSMPAKGVEARFFFHDDV